MTYIKKTAPTIKSRKDIKWKRELLPMIDIVNKLYRDHGYYLRMHNASAPKNTYKYHNISYGDIKILSKDDIDAELVRTRKT